MVIRTKVDPRTFRIRNRREAEIMIQALTLEKLRADPDLYSYNFEDVVVGQTLVNFYAGSGRDSSGTETYIHFPNTFTSETTKNVSSQVTDKNATFTKQSDIDYDFTINVTSIVDNRALVEIHAGLELQTGTGGGPDPTTQGQAYHIVKIRHYDGTTETDLGSGKTETFDITEGALDDFSTESSRQTLILDLTRQLFKPGDILRVTVESWVALPQTEYTTGDYARGFYYTDPTSTGSNDLVIKVPFRLGVPVQ